MTQYSSWLRPGDLLPNLLIRPFCLKTPYRLDNRVCVYAWPSSHIFTPIGSGVLALFGMMFMFAAFLTGAPWAYVTGFCLMLIDGGGLLLIWPMQRSERYDVFDRVNGVVRVTKRPEQGQKGRPWPLYEYPFQECEARLKQKSTRHGFIQFGLAVYHPSEKHRVFDPWDFAERNHALGFWSFLNQYMDKGAPLPDMASMHPYPHRTKGLCLMEEWDEFKRRPGYVDPLEVFFGYWKNATPGDCREIYDLYEPRNMPVDFAPAPPDSDPCYQVRVEADDTLLPKRLLRPFIKPKPVRLDDQQYVYEQPNTDNRYFYLVFWTLLCTGLVSFGFSAAVAWTGLAAAGGFLAAFIKFRRKRGTTFDREKGEAVFHKGLRFTPLRLPFDRCTGRLIKTEHREGFTSYNIDLRHPKHGSFNLDNDRFMTLDHLLGFWSFIVQYMDKTAPLPDVPEFSGRTDLAEGLGPWETWAEQTLAEDFVDPFEQWQNELEANSSSDTAETLKQKCNSQTDRITTGPAGQSV